MNDYKNLMGAACAGRWQATRHAAAVLVPNPRLPDAALRIACACADLALVLLATCDDSRELVRAFDALRDAKDAGCTGVLGVYKQLDDWQPAAEEV